MNHGWLAQASSLMMFMSTANSAVNSMPVPSFIRSMEKSEDWGAHNCKLLSMKISRSSKPKPDLEPPPRTTLSHS